jgi:hypothetical protein
MSAVNNKRNLSDKKRTSFYKLVLADIVIILLSWQSSCLRCMLNLSKATSKLGMAAMWVLTDKPRVTPCLLSRLSAVSLLNLSSLARRIICLSPTNYPFYKNFTVTKPPHFSKLWKHPTHHDVKVRGASVTPTSKFRVSAILLLLILVRGCVLQ